jgi:hypothetical protein
MAADDPDSGIQSYDAHDRAVMRRINKFIALANAKCAKCTIAHRLEMAWASNIKDREINGTTDTVGRDADYYFASRHSIAAQPGTLKKEAMAIAGTAATLGYIGLKFTMHAVSVGAAKAGLTGLSQSADQLMRTDKDKPNSPPGGFGWEQRGEVDGKKDLGDKIAPALFHHPS